MRHASDGLELSGTFPQVSTVYTVYTTLAYRSHTRPLTPSRSPFIAPFLTWSRRDLDPDLALGKTLPMLVNGHLGGQGYTMHTMEEQEAEQAGEPRAAVPDGEEIGLKTARTMLGKLTARADLLDEVIYLTNSGTREAAIVPADAARTRAQLAAEQQAAPAPNDELLAEIVRLRTKLIGLQVKHTDRIDAQELYWAEAVLGLWEIMAHMARAASREHELNTFSAFELKRKHAEEILTAYRQRQAAPEA